MSLAGFSPDVHGRVAPVGTFDDAEVSCILCAVHRIWHMQPMTAVAKCSLAAAPTHARKLWHNTRHACTCCHVAAQGAFEYF